MIFKTRHLLLIYSTITVAFVSVVFLKQRGYQDTWILQDVFVPTMVYILTSLAVAVLANDNRVVVLVCASFLVVLNAIPNLKYQLFYGTFDSVGHYGYVKGLLSLGFVPQTGFYASTYSDFPGMHIFIGSLSLILGVLPGESIKIVTSLIFGIIPLMTYFATNRVFEPNIQRFIIVAAGLPTVTSYALGGTPFAVPFYFSILCMVFRINLSTENKRQYIIVLLILVYGLLLSHAVTTLYLISFFVIALLLLKFLSIRGKRVLKGYQSTHAVVPWLLVILAVSFAARLAFGSGKILEIFTSAGESILIGSTSSIVPGRFFELPFSAQVIFLALNYAKDAVIGLMSFIGVIVLFVKLRRRNEEIYSKFYMLLLCFIGAILVLLTFQFLSGFSGIGYGRFITFAVVLSTFLVGLFLWHVNEHVSGNRLGPALIVLLLFLCISTSLIQIFSCQPIVPRANILSQDLPVNEYVYDYQSVNTVYQEEMIFFAEISSPNDARVASDVVTRWQIYGFANDAFISRHIYLSPLQYPNLTWDLFLLHYDGKAGPLNEKVEYRTNERLTELKDTLGNVVYDNGESFIIVR